jgi:predicted secreted hydrolase
MMARPPLLALLVLCGAASAAPSMNVLPPGAAGDGFEPALGARAFEFPPDHGPHPQFRQEWWYLTGNLDSASGERFGFELTFFRFALAPPAQAPVPGASAWRAREIYMAHFAVSDVHEDRFRFAQKLARGALDLAGAQGSPLRVWIDDWSLTQQPGSQTFSIRAGQARYRLELQLQPQQGPVLNGEAGLSRKSDQPGDASYYYSIPRLRAQGRLIRDGAAVPVTGLAWLDREWGSGGLAAQQTGWDWFGLQLADGSALMFYALRDRDGRPDPHSAGTFVASNGEVRSLSYREVFIAATGTWRTADGVRYPSGWQIRVPALALELQVRPVLADQELRTTPRYWEGAVDVKGERVQQPIGGRGYVELTGYGGER